MLDDVIHQQTRLAIMACLYRNRQASFTDLRDGLGLTPGNLQSHASRLEAAGYIAARRDLVGLSFQLQYRITPAGAEAFRRYLRDLEVLLATPSMPPARQAGASLPPRRSNTRTP